MFINTVTTRQNNSVSVNVPLVSATSNDTINQVRRENRIFLNKFQFIHKILFLKDNMVDDIDNCDCWTASHFFVNIYYIRFADATVIKKI